MLHTGVGVSGYALPGNVLTLYSLTLLLVAFRAPEGL